MERHDNPVFYESSKPNFQVKINGNMEQRKPTQPDSPGIRLNNIEFSYNSTSDPIFRGFSEQIAGGKITSLVGASGCGKTTLLDLIAGVLQPVEGDIIRDSLSKKMGYMFQEYPFIPGLSVIKHVSFPLRMQSLPRHVIRSKAEKWLQRIGLYDYQTYAIESLSAGMKARVALATVMIQEPNILLLDEPFRSLDLETRMDLWKHLYNVNKESHTTILLVTHDLNEVIALSDFVIVLGGRPCQVFNRCEIPLNRSNGPIGVLQDEQSGKFFNKLWSELRKAIYGDLAE